MPEDGTWIVRFGDKNWTEHVKKAAHGFKFNATLKPRLDVEVEDWHAAQPDQKPRTVIIEESGPDTTGLGPPLSIRYDFDDESPKDPAD